MIRRSYRRVYSLGESFVLDLRDFNFQVAISGLMLNLPKRLPQRRRIERMWIQRRHAAVQAYLTDRYLPAIDKYLSVPMAATFSGDAPIWVFWWQGEAAAPPIVQACLQSIRDSAAPRRVIFVSQHNFRQYTDVPESIMERFREGLISVTHLSDIIRFSLLADHGGFWLDATVFCANPVPEEVFRSPLFTCRSDHLTVEKYVSRYRWTSFAIGGWRSHHLFEAMRDFYHAYWSSESRIIDYLLIDYMIDICYRHMPSIRKDIDRITLSNPRVDDLVNVLSGTYDDDAWSDLQRETWMFKLTWRLPFLEQTEDGSLTFYGKLVRGELV